MSVGDTAGRSQKEQFREADWSESSTRGFIPGGPAGHEAQGSVWPHLTGEPLPGLGKPRLPENSL